MLCSSIVCTMRSGVSVVASVCVCAEIMMSDQRRLKPSRDSHDYIHEMSRRGEVNASPSDEPWVDPWADEHRVAITAERMPQPAVRAGHGDAAPGGAPNEANQAGRAPTAPSATHARAAALLVRPPTIPPPPGGPAT